jgi:hypothetical protein
MPPCQLICLTLSAGSNITGSSTAARWDKEVVPEVLPTLTHINGPLLTVGIQRANLLAGFVAIVGGLVARYSAYTTMSCRLGTVTPFE